MQLKIAEKNKNTGVCYAVTDEGIELPVIDVTHPAFAIRLNESELGELLQKHFRERKEQERIPGFLQRIFLSLMQRRSVLMRGIAGSAGSFMTGLNTYLLKLGPDNLGAGYATDIDRKVAASLPVLSVRLRLQDIARLLVEGLAPLLHARINATLHLLNIGGGPAIDSLNALIILQKEQPSLLAGRRIYIHSLDLDKAGPSFGARALASLLAEGGPLHRLDISLHHVNYNWSDPATLHELVKSFDRSPGLIVAASSEGALFEYGSDDEIRENLQALHETMPVESVIAGSVTRADEIGRLLNGSSRAAINLRGLEAFTELALHAGWKIIKRIDRPMSHDVLMKRA